MPVGSEEFGEEEFSEESQRLRHLQVLKSQLDDSGGSLAAVDWSELQNLLVGFGDSTLGSELLPVLQDTVSLTEKVAAVERIREEIEGHYPGSSAGGVMGEWREYLLQSHPVSQESPDEVPWSSESFVPEVGGQSHQGGSGKAEVTIVVHEVFGGLSDSDDDF